MLTRRAPPTNRSTEPLDVTPVLSIALGRIDPQLQSELKAARGLALQGLSESLRRELVIYGIDVITVAPGYVNTPILNKRKVFTPASNTRHVRPSALALRSGE